MKRLAVMLVAVVAVSGCNESTAAKNMTASGAALFEWTRADAKQGSPFSPGGPRHPVADGTVVEGPKDRAYTLVFKDVEGLSYSVELRVEVAKVAYTFEGTAVARWVSSKVQATLVSNDAFEVTGKCHDNLTLARDTMRPGDEARSSEDAVLVCQIQGHRPNSKGMEKAIEAGAHLRVTGSGEVTATGTQAEIIAK